MRKRIVFLLMAALVLVSFQHPRAALAQSPERAFTAGEATIPPTAAPQQVTIAAPTTSSSPTPAALPTDTPEPTPEPTPAPTPEPTVISAERLSSTEFDSYFDDAVFVGDSITKTFGNYVQSLRLQDEKLLGAAQFLGTISMNAVIAGQNRADGDICFRYQGRAMALTDALTAMNAGKAFILLGVNDIGWRRWTDVEESFARIIDNIHEQCPGVEVILFGILPVSRYYCRENKLDIGRWNSFNPILETVCRDHGAEFISFADQVMTEEGYLDLALSDGQFHLNPAGEDIWIAFLRRYAAQKLYPDAILEDS